MNCRGKMTQRFLKKVFLSLVIILAGQVTVVLAADISFKAPVQFATGTGPCRIAVADFNTDGNLDVVTADYGPYFGGASVLFGDGSGSLASPIHYAPYPNVTPRALATGDFNGDGKPDFAVGDFEGGNLSVFLNNDNVNFMRTSFYAYSLYWYWLAAGDLNGDGKPDLVMANLLYNYIRIYKNNTPIGSSTASFSYNDIYLYNMDPNTVNFGDVNGDGKLDLLVSGNKLLLLLGDGLGGFTLPPTVIRTTGASGGLFSDMNRDGKLDIVASVDGGVIVMLGEGDGTFKPETKYDVANIAMYPIVADLNGDGKLDIAVGTSSGNVSVLLGNRDGFFGNAVSFAAGGPVSYVIAAGDFNNDGKLDLIVPVGELNSIFILLNTTPPANNSPIANAGPNQTVSAGANGQADITLDGSGSVDPDGDTLTYTWSGMFGTVSGATPTVSLEVGTHTVTLTVDDGRGGTALATVTIAVSDTTPPVIGTVNDLTVDTTSPSGAVVTFDLPTVTDNVKLASVVAVPASGSLFPIGTTPVTMTASDDSGNASSATFSVTVLSTSQMTSNLIVEATIIFPQAADLLQNTISSLSKGNTGAACNQVKAFINQIGAQSGKKLKEEQANQLIGSANHIQDTLGCR